MRALIILTTALLPAIASAEDWPMRDGDIALSSADMDEQVIGRTLVFYDDGQAKFSAGGAYSYSYGGGGTSFGQFEIRGEGEICIAFRNGWSRCDMYVRNGDRLLVLTEKGERFPVKSVL